MLQETDVHTNAVLTLEAITERSSVHVRVPKPDVQSAGEATGSGLSTDLDVIPSPTAIPDDEAVSMDIQQVSADMQSYISNKKSMHSSVF